MNEIFYVHRNYLKNINFTLFNGKTVSRTECLPASDKTLIVVCFFPQSINIPLITATPYSLSLPTATAVTSTTASLPLDARRYKLSVVEAVYIIRRDVNYCFYLSHWLQILQLLIYAKYKRLLWCYVANRTLVWATKPAVITRIGRWVQTYTYDIVLILSEINVFMYVFPKTQLYKNGICTSIIMGSQRN